VKFRCRSSVTEIVTFENVTRVTVCALGELWCVLNEVMGEECRVPGLVASDIDHMVGIPGFGEALLFAGWVVEDEGKGLFFPNFLEHNAPQKTRPEPKTPAQRSKEYRGRKREEEARHARHDSSRGEEKRREEKRRTKEPKEKDLKNLSPLVLARSENQTVPAALGWGEEKSFFGITGQDREQWAEAFPAVEIDVELARAHAWLVANPKKAKRSNWRKFIFDWLSRSQDRGGTGGGVKPAEKQPRMLNGQRVGWDVTGWANKEGET
jgi:hypothetical protein